MTTSTTQRVPKMSRAHYQLIADVLAECRRKQAWCFDNDDDYHQICTEFAKALANTNPNFDAERFIKAAN